MSINPSILGFTGLVGLTALSFIGWALSDAVEFKRISKRTAIAAGCVMTALIAAIVLLAATGYLIKFIPGQ